MPTGLMAALVTRLADHLLIRRVVRRAGRLEPRAGADRRDQVGRIDRPPAGLGGPDEVEIHRHAGGAEPRPLVTRVRSRTVAKLDSIGLVVRSWAERGPTGRHRL